MLAINKIHHIAIISSDYEKSKAFYTSVLGLSIKQEVYRAERNSYKLDLTLNGDYVIELFSFPDPPQRLTRPESTGLRHLAFEVNDIEKEVAKLKEKGIKVEAIRVDEHTEKRFTFFTDPDELPIEIYEK